MRLVPPASIAAASICMHLRDNVGKGTSWLSTSRGDPLRVGGGVRARQSGSVGARPAQRPTMTSVAPTPTMSLIAKVGILRKQLGLPENETLSESISKAVNALGLLTESKDSSTMMKKVDACLAEIMGPPSDAPTADGMPMVQGGMPMDRAGPKLGFGGNYEENGIGLGRFGSFGSYSSAYGPYSSGYGYGGGAYGGYGGYGGRGYGGGGGYGGYGGYGGGDYFGGRYSFSGSSGVRGSFLGWHPPDDGHFEEGGWG